MEHEICTKMLRNLREKLPASTLGYSTANIARLGDDFLEVCEREASLVESQLLQRKIEGQTRREKSFWQLMNFPGAEPLLKPFKRCIKKSAVFLYLLLGSPQTGTCQYRPHHSASQLLHQTQGCLHAGRVYHGTTYAHYLISPY